jgi:hypothetical protein
MINYGKAGLTKEELELAQLNAEIEAAFKQGSPIGKLQQKYWRLRRRLKGVGGMGIIDTMEKGRKKVAAAKDKYDYIGEAVAGQCKKRRLDDDWMWGSRFRD